MTIEIPGLNAMVNAFNKAQVEMPNYLKNAMSNSVSKVRTDAQSTVPVRTGMLKKSIQQTVQDSPLIGKVIVGQPYGKYIEYGTKPHTIVPKNASVLAFPIGGSMVFATSVNHPGTKAKPFMTPAIEKNRTYIMDQFNRAMQSVVNILKG